MSETPNETPTPEEAPKSAKPKKTAKKDPVDKAPEPTPESTPSETPAEPAAEQPATVAEELSNRAEEPAAEKRNELVFDPSSGELVVKPKGESGSDAVIVSDIADEGFFAEGW
jgi:hypothetical protein